MVRNVSPNSVIPVLGRLKSLENKKIKKFVLSYESYMKNLLGKVEGSIGAKELHAFYFKLSN
jgi:hypothetical protein